MEDLAKALRDKLVFFPEEQEGPAGLVPELSQAAASPTGFDALQRPIDRWFEVTSRTAA